MPSLKQIVSSPEYQSLATAHSKAGGTVFAVTFIYLLFSSSFASGALGSVLFFGIGIFAVSFLISMPVLLLMQFLRPISGLLDFGQYILIVFATYMSYTKLFVS